MPLCMALHELATNAAKHGALSDDQGCVHLDWSRTDDGRVQGLRVEAIGHQTARLNANHVLAGKTLHFDVVVESVREATEDELQNGLAT